MRLRNCYDLGRSLLSSGVLQGGVCLMRQTQNQRLAEPIELRSKQLRKTATRPLVDRSDVVVPIGPHILNQRKNNWPQLSLQDGLFILRLSLATVFFWF